MVTTPYVIGSLCSYGSISVEKEKINYLVDYHYFTILNELLDLATVQQA